MDIEKAFEIEASSYFKKKKDKDSKQFGISKKKSNVRHGGSGYRDEEVKLDEMPNRAYKEKINSLLKDYHGKFKWGNEVLYVTKEIEKDVRDIISKDKGHSYMVKVSKNPMREEVEIEEKKSATGYELYHKDFSSAMQHAYKFAKSKGHIVDPKEIDDKVATGPKKPSAGKTNRYSLKAGRKTVEIQVANLDNKRYELNMYIEGLELIPEGFKDLPPHLQKLVKKIEKKQKDWNKQNPEAKIQTLVYNPETGKPDIIVKETMKLEDVVKDVLVGKKEEPTVEEQKVTKEDSDKDEPGTQGDMAAYQKKRKAVAKKFGVSSCSQLDGAKKKACYSALDKAHVADHEEQVELEKMRKEETQKTFSKMFTHIKTLKQGK